jgi:hypothetical protein
LHLVGDQPIAADLKVAWGSAVVARIAAIDGYKPPAMENLDPGQVRGVSDDDPLCSIGAEHRRKLLLDRRPRLSARCGRYLRDLRVAGDETPVPERAERVVKDRVRRLVD